MYGALKYKPNEKTNAVYVRISDDENKRGTYDSIANQISLLKELAVIKGLTNLEIYPDEGEKGGNFDRPAFNRMIGDIENDKVNCVLVKDLSRFGREHIDGDYYLEIFLPKHNVRFISQHEGFDSYLDPKRMNSIEAPLINLFNEQYLKQVSNSTKASLKIKRKEGKYVGSQVPYGFLRDPQDKHKLIVDEEVRYVIQEIFAMYLENTSMSEIARTLNCRGVLPPSQLKRTRRGQALSPSTVWKSQAVRSVLTQELLTGHMIQGKTTAYSHKLKKRIPLPREKWCIVRNTHEAIIDEDTFNHVQSLLQKETRPKTQAAKMTAPSLIAGFVECADCHKQMQRTKTKKNGKTHYYFRCRTNKQLGNTACTSHLIPEEAILDVLLASICSLVDAFVDIEAAVRRNANCELRLLKKRLNHQLEQAVSEHARIANTKANVFHMYINKLDETLTDDAYTDLRDSIDKMTSENEQKIGTIKQELKRLENEDEYMSEFMRNYGKYKGITVLTREVIADLVERIVISKDKTIRISFRFQDELRQYIKL